MKRFEEEYFSNVLLPSLKVAPINYDKAISKIQKTFEKNISLLDYGCGNGTFVKTCTKKGINAWGVDISNYSKQISEIPDRHEVLIDNKIPENFGLKHYNLCFCCGVLQYLSSNEIKELIKYLSPFCNSIWIETLTNASDEIPAKNDELNYPLRTRDWYNSLLKTLELNVKRIEPVYYKNAWLVSKR